MRRPPNGKGRKKTPVDSKTDGRNGLSVSARSTSAGETYFASFFAFGIGTSIFVAVPVSGVMRTTCPAFR